MKLKFIFAFLMVLSLNTLFSQTGKYCFEDDFWSSCYTFLPENKFEYTELMCVAQVDGKGHYKISNDTITFYYEPIDLNIKNGSLRDHYEAKKGTESYRIVGEINESMKLINDLFENDLEYRKIKPTALRND